MNKSLIILAAVIIAFIVVAAAFFSHRQADDTSPHPLSRQAAFAETERDGILSVADYTRLSQIAETIYHQQKMSDNDLDFWIATLHKGPLTDLPAKRMRFYSTVMGCAGGRKDLSPSQQKKMYDAVLPFVFDSAYANAMDTRGSGGIDPADPLSPESLRTDQEKMAIYLLAQTRDPRALGVLNNISQTTPDLRLRRTAQECHDKLATSLKNKP